MDGTIEIDTGTEALKERLALCRLRTELYKKEQEGKKLPEELADFFDTAFILLNEAETGDKSWRPAKETPELDFSVNCDFPLARPRWENLTQRLLHFWLGELAGLARLADGGSLEALTAAWETTLQMLGECEAFAEERPGAGKPAGTEDPGLSALTQSLKDIVYAYLYDYAEVFLSSCEAAKEKDDPLPRQFISKLVYRPEELFSIEDGLELFYGDRLKARILELRDSSAAKAGTGENGVPGEAVPSVLAKTEKKIDMLGSLSAHQKNALKQLYRSLFTVMLLLCLCFALTACGGDEEEAETEETTLAQLSEDSYPSTVTAQPEGQEETDYFGVMHAKVLDVQEGEKDGLFVYMLRDDEDPDNAWCLNSQDIGTVVCEMSAGKKVTALFSGDMIGDPDGVSFIALLDDAGYTIKKVEGTTISNMMNSFIIRTTKGVEMTFVKDNCKVDRDALSTDGNGKIIVYYADCGNVDLYPVRVYSVGK